MAATEHRWLVSRFPALCRECGSQVGKGDSILYFPDESKGRKTLCHPCGERFLAGDPMPLDPNPVPVNPAPTANNPHTPGTRQHAVAELFLQGQTADEIYETVRPFVGQIDPWILRQNAPGGRVPKPLSDQLDWVRHDINRICKRMRKGGGTASAPIKAPANKPVAVKRAPAGFDVDAERRKFRAGFDRARAYCEANAGPDDVNRVDALSTRALEYANQAITLEHIPAAPLLYSMVIDWPDAVREAVGIAKVNFADYSTPLPGSHACADYVVRLMRAGVPVWLCGPAGAGKSFLLKQAAEFLGLEYGECAMTAGLMPSWLIGAETMSGPKDRPFTRLYENGGVFNFEEIDAADANGLLLVNNALANGVLFNNNLGITHTRSSQCVFGATSNTWGNGANRYFPTRERLDPSTKDRFRMGRVWVDYDPAIADLLIFGEPKRKGWNA